ncbi:MAG: ribosomal protein S18-alanine N-acetyltransferase [Oscillospiraceae bacterium]|nr:ribosomal protein S18-alanine N-acetyltransferase [Oscillospiraceae bacterium]
MNSGITLRSLAAADLPAVARLERLCFSQPWTESALQSELENGCLFWGVVADRTARAGIKSAPAQVTDTCLAGYIGLKIAADEGYMGNLATAPDFRRRGIGSMLVSAVLEYAKKKRLAFVTLEARVSNAPARALYEKKGFTLMGIRPGFYSNPGDDAAIYTWKG